MSNNIQHLKEASREEQKEFLDSFDTILCDIDGVVWSGGAIIENAPNGIKSLKSLGKQVYFVTNNTTIPLELALKKLQLFEVKEDEIFRPDLALIWYLKSINFNKEIYVLGVKNLKNSLTDAGFKVFDDPEDHVQEHPHSIFTALKSINPNVGAVIIDMDLNLTFIKLQKCVEYIKNNDALFLVGGWDPIIPFKDTNLIGPKYFIQAVEDLSQKKPLILAKPYEEFHTVLEKTFGNIEHNRTLFIGDSVVTDMAYATRYGFKKLLPLTGSTTKEDLHNWKFEEELKPHYYIDEVHDLHHIIQNLDCEAPSADA